MACGGGGNGSDSGSSTTGAPVITTSPSGTTVLAGSVASFTVVASGAPAPTFQWERSSDGTTWTSIGGATAATYSFTAQAGDDQAQFRVKATNSAGSVTSTAATLRVNTAPTITTQPVPQVRTVGTSVTLTVAATARGTLSYQWRKDGNPISGATTDTYTKAGLTLADAGSYDVVLTSTLNGTTASQTSATAALQVVAAPVITSFTADPQWTTLGRSSTLTAVFSGGVGTVDRGIGSVASGQSKSTGPLGVPTTYTLTVVNAAGDSATATATVWGPSPFPSHRGYHSYALKADGTAWVWGAGYYDQLGNGWTRSSHTPTSMTGMSDVVAMASGWGQGFALKQDGTVWAWGLNGEGQLGDGTTIRRSTPVQATELTGVVALAGGDHHTLALKADGTVWACGYNAYGQLGDGTWTSRVHLVRAGDLTDVVAVAAGPNHSLALKRDGTVWAWGEYIGTSPVRVEGLTDVVAVAAGGAHNLALKRDGTVWAWGRNDEGQLGDGTTEPRTTLVQVADLTDVVAVTAGGAHSLALKQDGTVWAWGRNHEGQLGDGTTEQRTRPVSVSGLSNVVALGAGGYHSLALKQDGTVWAWGENRNGQLGNGTFGGIQTTPAPAGGLNLAWP